MIAPTLKQLDGGRQIEMHCFDYKSDNKNVPKYYLHVIDSNDTELLKQRKCAAFITPQGQEKASVFSTEMGR